MVRYHFLVGNGAPLFFVVFFDESRGPPLLSMRGDKKKAKCRNLFRNRGAYRLDLLDDNSLQLRVVNGGRASWFPCNLWCLVNQLHYSWLLRIIVSCGFSLFDLRPFSFSPFLSSPRPRFTPSFLHDVICCHVVTRQEKQLSMGWSKTINCCWDYFPTA